jgi:hypothetical protein
MRRFRSLVVVCLLVLAFGQACLGGTPPVPTQTSGTGVAPSDTPAPSGIGTTATVAAPTSPAPTFIVPPQPTGVPTATLPAASAGPSPTATQASGPTATAPRLGLDPPGTPQPPRPTVATPGPVVLGREATIAQVQGAGDRTPFLAQTVRIVGAIVTADFQQLPAQGFFVQERNPSAQDASTGIFVYQGGRATPDVKLGDEVTLVGVARETSGRTQIDISQAASHVTIISSGNALPPPLELRPPPGEEEARAYLERFEGMLVGLPTAIVVGPTNDSGEFVVVREDTEARRVFADNPNGSGWRVVVGDDGGVRYEVAVGDRVDGVVGPLDYSTGLYKVQQLPEPRLVIAAPARLPPAFPAAGSGEFTVASFNLENLFDPNDTPNKRDPCDRDENGRPCRERVTPADFALKLSKAGQAVRNVLGGPTIVAVQEVESLGVLNALAASPDLAPLDYGAVLLEGPDPRGIDVGLLYRRDRVAVTGVYQHNACTTLDLGFDDEDERCRSQEGGPFDGHFLAARPPLVVSLTIRGPSGEFPLTVIVAHFKSKSGTDPEGQGFTGRRVEEARLVAGIVNDLLAVDPDSAIMVLGDLNDSTNSEPLRVLTAAAPLQNLTLQVPPAERYSSIVSGLSQVLDHILVTAQLRTRLIRITFAHLDADYPVSLGGQPVPYQVSDHDPPLARFRLP